MAASSSRSTLLLTAEEERVLIGKQESFQLLENGDLLVSEERIFLHFRDRIAPPMILYLSKPKIGERRRIDSSLEELQRLPFANPVAVIGQSRGLVCYRDLFDSNFYIYNVASEEVVGDITGYIGPPLPGFRREATFGFGHTAEGYFKIVMFPFCLILGVDMIPDRVTHFYVYDSLTHTWARKEFPEGPLCTPECELGLMCPKHSSVLFKVRIGGICNFAAYNLEEDSFSIILREVDIRHVCGRDTDLLRTLVLGPGCNGDILGCKLTKTANVSFVELYTLFRVNQWRLAKHSRFDLPLPADTTRLLPLAGLNDAEQQLQFLFFFRNDKNIIGIKFDQFDGWLWQPAVNFKLHLVGIRDPQPARYDAIALGPCIIPMQDNYEGTKKLTTKCGGDKRSENTGPSSSKGTKKLTKSGGKRSKRMGTSRSIKGYRSQAAKSGRHGSPPCQSFSLEELKEATKDFDCSLCMGGGSMRKIYKGKLENGTSVAIRSLAISEKCSTQNLKVQLDSLSNVHHPHLVVLLGHCIDCSRQDDSGGNRLFLVYEDFSGGNYRSYLSENHPEKVLKWPDRLAILIGVAKAVHFLHTRVIPGSFNNNLKTNNILLDEHGVPKLSDYGMSIITEEIEKFETKSEGPNSCLKKDLEGDVYNFGYLLLESIAGPIISGKGETFVLNKLASFGSQDGRRRNVDPTVLTTCSQESLSVVSSIIKKCISPEVSTRPSFEDVLCNLLYAAKLQATADDDQESDATV